MDTSRIPMGPETSAIVNEVIGKVQRAINLPLTATEHNALWSLVNMLLRRESVSGIGYVLMEVKRERNRQDTKWGEQNHPDFRVAWPDGELASPEERTCFYSLDNAKLHCDIAAEVGELDWAHILVEEVAETLEAKDESELREELVQVAAVAVAWIEAIDRRRRT